MPRVRGRRRYRRGVDLQGVAAGVDNKNSRGIAYVGIGYYLALLVDPPRSLFPLNYHY